MDRSKALEFELYIINLCEKCKTVEDYEKLSEQLHQIVENAIEEMCMDNGIEDYEPYI